MSLAERIIQLNAWTESKHFYTAKEIAAIELTEAITVLTDGFVPDEVYAKAAAEFDETELSHLIAAITTINAFNRFGVSTRMVPGQLHAGRLQCRGNEVVLLFRRTSSTSRHYHRRQYDTSSASFPPSMHPTGRRIRQGTPFHERSA